MSDQPQSLVEAVDELVEAAEAFVATLERLAAAGPDAERDGESEAAPCHTRLRQSD